MRISVLSHGLVMQLTWLIFSCAVLTSLHADSPKSPSQPKSEQELRVIVNQTCDAVIKFYKAEGFPNLLSSHDDRSFRYQPDDLYHTAVADYHEAVGEFVTDSDPPTCNATMLCTTGRFIGFSNVVAEHAFQKSTYTETKPTAKWTEAHAIEIASKFADIFTKPWEKKYLGKPTAEFTWSGNDVDKKTGKLLWGPGRWKVSWPQETAFGIPYGTGGVGVDVSEEYGPGAVSINFSTQYDDVEVTPIPREKALIEARKGFDSILSEERANGTLPNAKLVSEEKPLVDFFVAKPNPFLSKLKTMPKSGFPYQGEGRLAWRIAYKITTSDQYTHGYLGVYIDAKDGRLLCYDLTSLFW
jgi:hypothetical protein